jgi:hypothetical protein
LFIVPDVSCPGVVGRGDLEAVVNGRLEDVAQNGIGEDLGRVSPIVKRYS